MDTKHVNKVKALQAQIEDYYKQRVPFRVYHGSTNSTRVLTFKRSEMVDTSALNRVLSVDTTKKVAIVEPNVPMDKLVAETLKYGLIPPVVMEVPGITVGGAIQGGAAETSSHKYGAFSQASGAGQVYVCQDILLPQKGLLPFVEFIEKQLDIYPLPVPICAIKPETF